MRLAARGARETTSGVAAVEDAEEVQTLRRQATRVWREATALAVVATAVVMLARGLFGG